MSALANDRIQLIKCSCGKAKIVMLGGLKHTGFLRHQAAQAGKQDRNFAGKSFIRGECAWLCNYNICGRNVAVNVLNKTDRSCPGITSAFDTIPQLSIFPANNQNV